MAFHTEVTATQHAQMLEIIALLAQKISANLPQVQQFGLLSGLAGQLLFLYKAHQFNPSLINEHSFNAALENLQEHLAEQSFELSNGLAGQAWVLEYFNQAEQADYDPNLLEDVDALFQEALSPHPWGGEIEMVLGLGGYAPYAARRAKFTDQHALFANIVAGFESTLTTLDDGTLTWSQPENSVYRFDKENKHQAEYNLGLAHGVPGIIAALLPAYQQPALADKVRHLLEGGCDWLLAQRNPDRAQTCGYGSCADGHFNSRLGWCYGDLTIALTLARVGQALDRPSYIAAAKEIALHATKRDPKSGAINDAGLCHGFFGMVTIYQLLNALMPDAKFVEAQQFWLDYGLAQYAEKGERGLYCYSGISKEYEEEFGFLMGYAGIGLALLAVLDNNPDWADCLLMA